MQILAAGCFGTYYLLELARSKKAGFVFASSSEVYGDPLENPQREDYWGNVNTTGKRSIYDEGKRFSESMVTAFHKEYGLDIRIVRIFNTYGERMQADDGRAIPTFISQAILNEKITIFGDGSHTRSPQYISDLVGGILALVDNAVVEPVNIGNPIEMTILELALLIVKLADSKSEIAFTGADPEDDPKVRKPDITKAKILLNWSPNVTPEEGLSKTIQWFKTKLTTGTR